MQKYYIFKEQPDHSKRFIVAISEGWNISYTDIIIKALDFESEAKAKNFLNGLEETELQILKYTTQEEIVE